VINSSQKLHLANMIRSPLLMMRCIVHGFSHFAGVFGVERKPNPFVTNRFAALLEEELLEVVQILFADFSLQVDFFSSAYLSFSFREEVGRPQDKPGGPL
jgi:hypothetical protein